MKKWKQFEHLVELIYKELQPESEVKINDQILGINSGIERQIDISIRTKFAGSNILVIVQAKDYKAKADINVVGAFASVIKDVRASKGVLICNKGFTSGAKKLARNLLIDIFSAHDISEPNWSIDYKMPILVRQIKLKIDFEQIGVKQRKTEIIKADPNADLFYRKWVLTLPDRCGIKIEHASEGVAPILKVCVSNVKVFCGFKRKSRSGR